MGFIHHPINIYMKIKEGFVSHQIGDKTMVIGTGELSMSFNGIIELNATAAEIWKWIEKEYDEENMVKMLAQKYHIAEEKAKEDIEKIVHKMKENGIFENET